MGRDTVRRIDFTGVSTKRPRGRQHGATMKGDETRRVKPFALHAKRELLAQGYGKWGVNRKAAELTFEYLKSIGEEVPFSVIHNYLKNSTWKV